MQEAYEIIPQTICAEGTIRTVTYKPDLSAPIISIHITAWLDGRWKVLMCIYNEAHNDAHYWLDSRLLSGQELTGILYLLEPTLRFVPLRLEPSTPFKELLPFLGSDRWEARIKEDPDTPKPKNRIENLELPQWP